MRVYFGKELRQPIHDAFKAICDYFNNMFDVATTTKSSYESNMESNMCRNRTLYAMTDEKTEEYDGRHYICNMLDGAYLGSTELQNGILDEKMLFEKTGTPEPGYNWDETKIGVMVLDDNYEPIDPPQVTYYDNWQDAADSLQSVDGGYWVHQGRLMNPVPELTEDLFSWHYYLAFIDLYHQTSIPNSCFANAEYGGLLSRVTGLDSVTYIGEWAFGDNFNLNVSIPSTATYIGPSAFRNTCIETAIIPEGITEIHDEVFYGCEYLANVSLPNSITSIGDTSFYGCSSITSIEMPSNLRSIGYMAFCECTSLTSLNLPASLTTISEYAFDGCNNLTSIIINKPQNSISGAPWGATNATITWTG